MGCGQITTLVYQDSMHDGSDDVKDIFPNSKGFVSNGNANR